MGRTRGKRATQSSTRGDELTGTPPTSTSNSAGRTKNKRRRRAAIDAKERRQRELKFSGMTKREKRRLIKKARGEGGRTPQPSF